MGTYAFGYSKDIVIKPAVSDDYKTKYVICQDNIKYNMSKIQQVKNIICE